MLNLARVIQPWKEADALSAHINLYGFWNETAFLTKSGDLGMVLSVAGVDYESLDNDEQQYAVKRLESALKSFGEGFHVYQYLFKTNRPEIPFASYDDELIDAAIDQRQQYFESKRDRLYEVELFYVIVLEGARSKTGILSALARMPRDPQGAIRELKAQFTSDDMKVLLRKQIDTDLVRIEQCVQNFTRQLADLMPIEVQGQQAQFRFFRRLLNFDEWRIAGKPQSTQYLDFRVVNSNIEAERDHLRVGDHFVRILTMKEAIAETRPLVLDRLFKIEGNFYVVTEWTPLSMSKARKEVDKRRRLEYMPSFSNFWKQEPALGQGRLFGNFESYLGKPKDFIKWFEDLTGWIRKHYLKNSNQVGGYVDPMRSSSRRGEVTCFQTSCLQKHRNGSLGSGELSPRRLEIITSSQAVSKEAVLLRLGPSVESCGDREKEHAASHRVKGGHVMYESACCQGGWFSYLFFLLAAFLRGHGAHGCFGGSSSCISFLSVFVFCFSFRSSS